MKFGIQLFGVLKDPRSDTMDFSYAVMAGPDLLPPAVRTRFSDALTARMTASLTTSAAREPTRSRSARVLFLPGTVIMIPDAPGFSNRTQVTTDTGIPYI